MRELVFFLSNYLFFLATTNLLASLECSLWLQIFGNSPGPHLWIPALVFWSLYRRTEEGIAMVYILTLMLTALSAVSGSLFLLTNMSLFVVLILLKQRIYTSGALNFMLICGATSLGFPLLHAGYSWTFEDNPVSQPAWFHWILEPLLTMLVALPLYAVFLIFDRITHKQRPKQMEALSHE